MRYIVITFLLVFNLSEAFAQVGINTTDPQQEVHVAGLNENVRVEGLDSINNINNFGMGSTTRVLVDADGDLILGSSSGHNIFILVDAENYLDDDETPSNVIIQTGTGLGYRRAGVLNELDPNYNTFVFELTSNAIVEVNYSVSWSIYDAISLSKKRLDDERSRIIQTGIYFRKVTYDANGDEVWGDAVIEDEDGVNINGGPWCIEMNPSGTTCLEEAGLIALNGQFYKNANQEHGAYFNLKNTASDYVKLPAGHYVALFVGRIEVADINAEGAAKMWVGSGQDELQIIAHYYN
ncbi:MAG: hypothetical protein IMY67_05660 [Bacteroidetes bacterium]|nr:hypothetical protein [Bacteroidota bacterium]